MFYRYRPSQRKSNQFTVNVSQFKSIRYKDPIDKDKKQVLKFVYNLGGGFWKIINFEQFAEMN